MIVYLVRGARGGYELYAHPSETEGRQSDEGVWGARFARFRERWQAAVREAQHGRADAGTRRSLWVRARHSIVCRLADSLEEQRTLWALRHAGEATLRHPPEMTSTAAADAMRRLLLAARRQHGFWLIVDALLFAASGLLVLVPGPNVVAYYFAFRVVGHYLSWQGARAALDRIAWTIEPGS